VASSRAQLSAHEEPQKKGVPSYSYTVETDGTVDMGICAQTNAQSDKIGNFLC